MRSMPVEGGYQKVWYGDEDLNLAHTVQAELLEAQTPQVGLTDELCVRD